MSEENKKTVEVYKKTAHLYLANSAEHDRLDQNKADKKCKKLEKLSYLMHKNSHYCRQLF